MYNDNHCLSNIRSNDENVRPLPVHQLEVNKQNHTIIFYSETFTATVVLNFFIQNRHVSMCASVCRSSVRSNSLGLLKAMVRFQQLQLLRASLHKRRRTSVFNPRLPFCSESAFSGENNVRDSCEIPDLSL